MKRLAVFFPGIGYTVDKPLMYYSRRLAEKHGFEICLLTYRGFPKKVKGDKGKMQESYKIALKQAKEMLSDIDFEDYDDILFVGKSIGTIVAAKLASKSSVRDRIRFIFYTPLEETFSFPIQRLKRLSLFRCRTRSFLPARQIHGWKPGAFLRFARNRVSSALLSRTRIIRWKLLTRSRTSSRSKRLCLKLNSIWLNKKQRRPFLRNLGLRCCLLNVRP